MLVLTRQVNETIVVGDVVEIRMAAIYRSGVRLEISFLSTAAPSLTIPLDLDESVEIGEHIKVITVSARGDRAQLGITAPPGRSRSRPETRPA